MQIAIIRLLLDFGLVVLIWIIQLIIYPSFLFYNKDNLITWHKKYTTLIGCIVSPLMLSQLGIATYQIIRLPSLYTVVSLVVIILIWITTFLIFVPLHSKISNGNASKKILGSLVTKNWIRTLLWVLLFLYSFFEVLDFFN